MDEDDEESEGDADDTFAGEDPRRMTLDPEGNEVTISDEEAAGMVEDEEVEAGEEVEDELMQDRGMLLCFLWNLAHLANIVLLQKDHRHHSLLTYVKSRH